MAELLGGGGPERVAGRQQHRAPGSRLPPGQLADGGRLADTVDPDDQPDVGRRPPCRRSAARGPGGVEQLTDGAPERLEQVVAAGDLLGVHLGPELVEQRGGRRDADVGPDERLLQRRPRSSCVDPAASATRRRRR